MQLSVKHIRLLWTNIEISCIIDKIIHNHCYIIFYFAYALSSNRQHSELINYLEDNREDY